MTLDAKSTVARSPLVDLLVEVVGGGVVDLLLVALKTEGVPLVEKLQAVAAELDALSSTGSCVAVPGDVRKYESCESVVKTVVERFGRVDILVNGAAGNFLASAEKLTTNGFRTVMEIDTLGTFNDQQVQQQSLAAFAAEMRAEGEVPETTLLAIGRLIEHLRERQKEERRRFAERFGQFDTTEHRDTFRALFRHGRSAGP